MRIQKEDKVVIGKRYQWDYLEERFLNSKKSKGTKDSSIALQRRHLSQIRAVFEEQSEEYVMDVRTIDLFVLEDVRSKLLEERKASTVNSMLRTLKSYFNYCHKHKIIDENPTVFLEAVKQSKDDKYIPTDNEIELIKKKMYANCNTVERLKFAVCIELILETANRITETLAIKWSDIDSDNLTIRLDSSTTKSGNTNLKYISEEMLEKLLMLKKYYPNNEYVFCNRNGNVSHRNNVRNWFNTIVEDINPNITLHSLRHKTITSAIEKGIQIEYVSKYIANHSSISITMEKYYHPSKELAEQSIRSKLFSR